MSPPVPALDFAKLTYPTDRLTLGAVRAAAPELFAQDQPAFWTADNPVRDAVAGMCWIERVLAERAFHRALDPAALEPPAGSRATLIGALNRGYERFGISSGPAQTGQLVRRLETAAAGLASAPRHQR